MTHTDYSLSLVTPMVLPLYKSWSLASTCALVSGHSYMDHPLACAATGMPANDLAMLVLAPHPAHDTADLGLDLNGRVTDYL